MKRILDVFIGLPISVLLLTSIACQTVTDYILSDPEPYPLDAPVTVEPEKEPSTGEPSQGSSPGNPLFCPQAAKNILEAAEETYLEDYEDDNFEEPEQENIITYLVNGNQISDPYSEDIPAGLFTYLEDEATHQKIWNNFTTLIPLHARESVLVEFTIMTDGKDNGLAAVAQTYNDPQKWALEVDIADSDDTLNLTYTSIHEFGHILTLGPDQVIPSIAVFNNPDDEDIYYDEANACSLYFPGEGCSLPNSYINRYYNEFWKDIYDEWENINLIEDDDIYYTALDDFYYKYEDRFVTGYAATNPEEDIAESFTFFILSPRPEGNSIAEEKTLFFYKYPELVQLREEINTGICSVYK